jgi:hypothetical protein
MKSRKKCMSHSVRCCTKVTARGGYRIKKRRAHAIADKKQSAATRQAPVHHGVSSDSNSESGAQQKLMVFDHFPSSCIYNETGEIFAGA